MGHIIKLFIIIIICLMIKNNTQLYEKVLIVTDISGIS